MYVCKKDLIIKSLLFPQRDIPKIFTCLIRILMLTEQYSKITTMQDLAEQWSRKFLTALKYLFKFA